MRISHEARKLEEDRQFNFTENRRLGACGFSTWGPASAGPTGHDDLLTWNLRHLANAVLRGKIEEAVRAAGLVPPIICTPEELMEPKL